MKILIFYNTAWYIYNFRSNLIRELQAQGCSIVAVAPWDPYAEKLQEMGVQFEPISLRGRSLNPFKELLVIKNFIAILKRVKPDYILSYTVKCNLYAGICRCFYATKQIANVSGLGEAFEKHGLLNKIVRTLYKISMRKANCVFFQNRDDLVFCVKQALVPAHVARVLPGSGVDLDRFTVSEGSTHSDSRTFLMFGRLLKKKGYDTYLEAAAILKAQYGAKATFRVLGMVDEERAESTELFSRVKKAAEAGIIEYLAATDEVLPHLQATDVVVLPSQYNEGIPRSLLEGLAAGKALVTTDWKGCRETVVDGKNGYLVPAGNVTALAKAMETLIVIPQEHFRLFGFHSRALAEKRFDERIVIGKYFEELGLVSMEKKKDRPESVEVHFEQASANA